MSEHKAAGDIPSLARDGAVATIRLNRPAQHNRIEPIDLTTLNALLDRVDADPAARVLVLTATGKSFSSGFNIGELGGASPAAEDAFEAVADRLERFRLPTVCALNGGVYGGSTDLALACDFRLGVVGMSLRMPAARLGLHYYAGGLRRYVSRLGLGAAKRLFLTAETIGAETLLRIGFLDELLPAGTLGDRVQALAEVLAANAPRAVQGMKASLNAIARGDADDQAIDRAFHASKQSQEAAEGRAAWAEKRPPRFEGL